MYVADWRYDGEPDQCTQQLDPAVWLREHQLSFLQPHDEHWQHGDLDSSPSRLHFPI